MEMERRVDIYLETEGEGDNCDNGGDEVQYISELDLSLARKNLFLYPINFGSSYTVSYDTYTLRSQSN
jgi:hypothetical protein